MKAMLILLSLVLIASCGGSGGSSDTTDNLYPGALGNDSGAIATDGSNTLLGLTDSNDTSLIETVLIALEDGTEGYITVATADSATDKAGFPTAIQTTSGNPITFQNWSAGCSLADYTTNCNVDVCYDGTCQNADLSSLAAMTIKSCLKDSGTDWGGFFNALYVTVKLGSCPASIALAAGSGGAAAPLAVGTCALAANTLWNMLSDNDEVEGNLNQVDLPSSCSDIRTSGVTEANLSNCLNDASDEAIASGSSITDGGSSSSEFIGSCQTTAAGGVSICANYINQNNATAELAQADCEASNGTYSASNACTSTGSVGACSATATYQGKTATMQTVFYNVDSAAAEAVCDQLCAIDEDITGCTYTGTYVPPTGS